MATSYSMIFESFLGKITDHSFLDLTEVDLEKICSQYLKSAIVKFKSCRSNLKDRDDVTKTFNVDLDDEEIDILAVQMVVEWLDPLVTDITSLRQNMNDRMFEFYSQQSHLKQLMAFQDRMETRAKKMMRDYTYSKEELEGL